MRATEFLRLLAPGGQTLLVCGTVAILGACTPGVGCSCGPEPPDLPGEFEECTEDLRCAAGLQCFTGGGKCEKDPPFFSFCARACVGDVDCGGAEGSCTGNFDRTGKPDGFCHRSCVANVDCELLLPTVWACAGLGGGYCVLWNDGGGGCTPIDGGGATYDAGAGADGGV